MRVLNAYAGIGGNRHLWPEHWEVTAVELDERTAAEYQRRYPQDRVLVEDAHAHVMNHGHIYAGVWSSPPCPSHSQLAKVVASIAGVPVPAPDPRLAAEIDHLMQLGGRYVVENVHTYYEPRVLPDVVTDRHYYWTNNPPALLTQVVRPSMKPQMRSDQYAAYYGLPPLERGAVADIRKAMKNAVIPIEGLELAEAAFG